MMFMKIKINFIKFIQKNDFKNVFENQDLLILNLVKNTKFELKYEVYDVGITTKRLIDLN